MGQNLAFNLASRGFTTSGFNRSKSRTSEVVQNAKTENLDKTFLGYNEITDFVSSLAQHPRIIIMLVKAGRPVDDTIQQLIPLLDPNDLVIDGGNEWYAETERRIKLCSEHKIRYMGMGVSGGGYGARHGPSLMPGGSVDCYNDVRKFLTKIAAQVDDGPCVAHIGPGGSGNYVKMIHNGIEYGDMQLIAEAYDVLRRLAGMSNTDLQTTFKKWNSGELESYLIEITFEVLSKKDDLDADDKAPHLVDRILDCAGSKGTGKWTVQVVTT
eukprot:CAMPEP_0113846860 /NCGR_PEP_ID=MMETSP0372-20130328/1539_1 /TAXON_ID=340204 /ORGANISM="Lankesteria abbotti" /LENGTH=268 /DNA_ID=CAMNT_0000816045 /DNA_START=772 /DNA_END=1578 /DNA_ORIENTATION=+ /assembly_acc=CAM_ASM_000359